MSVREAINRHQTLAGGIALVIAIIALYFTFRSASSSNYSGIATASFYSADDGKSWFKDDLDKIPPFDHDGKQAVRAHVYRCQDTGKEFVGYLEKFSPEGKSSLEKLTAENALGDSATVSAIYELHVQAKKPGQGEWVKLNSPQGQDLRIVKCDDASIAEVVLP